MLSPGSAAEIKIQGQLMPPLLPLAEAFELPRAQPKQLAYESGNVAASLFVDGRRRLLTFISGNIGSLEMADKIDEARIR